MNLTIKNQLFRDDSQGHFRVFQFTVFLFFYTILSEFSQYLMKH